MGDNFGLKDSGERRDFGTGSRRDVDTGKPRPDLISPYALIRVGAHLAKGAIKYGVRNWEKGQPVTVLLASTFRHLTAYMIGQRDEDHLAAAIFGLQAIIHFEERALLGDQVALDMLDDYASKDLSDQIRREQSLSHVFREAEQAADLKEDILAGLHSFLEEHGGREEIRTETVLAARSSEDEWLNWAAEGDHAVLNPEALRVPTNDFLDNA